MEEFQKYERSRGFGRLLLVLGLSAFVIVLGAVAFSGMFGHERMMVIAIVSVLILALLGALALIAIASGMLQFGSFSSQRQVITQIADLAEEGFVAVDAASRIVYANATYLQMAKAQTLGEVRPVQRLFPAGGDIAEAIYRLSVAARDGKAASEEFRLSKSLEGDRPAWYRVKTTPLTGDRLAQLSLWSIADISLERDRQENVFQELQQAIDYLDQAPAGGRKSTRLNSSHSSVSRMPSSA